MALTDYYVQERYPGDKYQEKVDYLQNEVGRLNVEDMANPTSSHVPENERIAFSEEFRFLLPRFWNLYDSMMHSVYISSRLGTWETSGALKLKTLLAKLGIPMTQAKQKYAHMLSQHKQQLENRISDFAIEFGEFLE